MEVSSKVVVGRESSERRAEAERGREAVVR